MNSTSNLPVNLNNWKRYPIYTLFFSVIFSLSSCYSTIIYTRDGIGTSDINNTPGFYRGLQVLEIDTTINLSIAQDNAMPVVKCPDHALFSVEHKATLGGLLLNAVTFGKRKRIKVKYVCTKPIN